MEKHDQHGLMSSNGHGSSVIEQSASSIPKHRRDSTEQAKVTRATKIQKRTEQGEAAKARKEFLLTALAAEEGGGGGHHCEACGMFYRSMAKFKTHDCLAAIAKKSKKGPKAQQGANAAAALIRERKAAADDAEAEEKMQLKFVKVSLSAEEVAAVTLAVGSALPEGELTAAMGKSSREREGRAGCGVADVGDAVVVKKVDRAQQLLAVKVLPGYSVAEVCVGDVSVVVSPMGQEGLALVQKGLAAAKTEATCTVTFRKPNPPVPHRGCAS